MSVMLSKYFDSLLIKYPKIFEDYQFPVYVFLCLFGEKVM